MIYATAEFGQREAEKKKHKYTRKVQDLHIGQFAESISSRQKDEKLSDRRTGDRSEF